MGPCAIENSYILKKSLIVALIHTFLNKLDKISVAEV
jgi:hypothetical protein